MSVEIFVLSALRAVVEVALLSLLGKGAVGLLAGAGREKNPVYRLFRVIADPPLSALRRILPDAFHERNLAFMATALFFVLWIGLGAAKRALCAGGSSVC